MATREQFEPVNWPSLEKVFLDSSGRAPTGHEKALLQSLFAKRGESDTVSAVQLLFGDDFAWVKNNKLDFALNDSTWNKHLVSALQTRNSGVTPSFRRTAGEQAEFGERPEGIGYRKEW